MAHVEWQNIARQVNQQTLGLGDMEISIVQYIPYE